MSVLDVLRECDENSQRMIAVATLDEFVRGASDVIRDTESLLQSPLAAVAAAEPV
jgi:hypothetical protein